MTLQCLGGASSKGVIEMERAERRDRVAESSQVVGYD